VCVVFNILAKFCVSKGQTNGRAAFLCKSKAADSKFLRRNDSDGEGNRHRYNEAALVVSFREWVQTLRCLNRIVLALPVVVLSIAGCAGRPPSPPSSTVVSVNPPSITVSAGSTTTFAAVFTPSSPEGGTLTWSVNPASGGAISDAGVYTASGTAGNYGVVATWTPASSSTGRKISGSATVDVVPPPQLGAALDPGLVQASEGSLGNGPIQNGAIVGQSNAFVISVDPNANVQVRSGFAIPVACPANAKCE
jgi:hypothetical protein